MRQRFPRDIPTQKQGAALLVVLLLVALLASLAVWVLEDMRLSWRRSVNGQIQSQMTWQALGAESFVRGRIADLNRSGVTALTGGWTTRDFLFPTDEGNMLSIQLRDGGNCLNLNGVIAGKGDVTEPSPRGQAQLAALIRRLSPGTDADGIVAALTDWVDADTRPTPNGGEDSVYAGLSTPYLTGQTLLADETELLAIRGVTPAVFARLRPYVCALPEAQVTRLNPNTLTLDQAFLLSVLSGGAISEGRAIALIRSRPSGGWTGLDPVYTHPALGGETLPQALRDQLSLKTQFFVMEASVTQGQDEAYIRSLFEARPDRILLHRRALVPPLAGATQLSSAPVSSASPAL
ncbi:MAG: type II secretion system minor pseudopilin GspK [Asticcacaulis sp.]